MIAFLLTAFFVGFLIVYVLPKVNGWIAGIPQLSTISQNKFAQLLIVGVVVIVGLHVFLGVVKKAG
jgi:succinate dehydrogenase/fumarate reductase cytochrome b subunit